MKCWGERIIWKKFLQNLTSFRRLSSSLKATDCKQRQSSSRWRQRKTYQLLEIARRRLFVNEIVTRRTKFKLTKRIIELALKARRENLVELNAFIDIGVDREGNEPQAVYARVVGEIFEDGLVHWGRIVAFFAWTIYCQRRLDIKMEKEIADFVEEFFFDGIDNRHVPGGWDVVGFFTNSTFISLPIKLVAIVSHFGITRFWSATSTRIATEKCITISLNRPERTNDQAYILESDARTKMLFEEYILETNNQFRHLRHCCTSTTLT